MWNAAGTRPDGCDLLERLAQQQDPEARVWTGRACRRTNKAPVSGEHRPGRVLVSHLTLLQRVLFVPDIQSAWAWLLHFASGGAKYRVVRCLQEVVTKTCGGVSARFSTWPRLTQELVGWDCATLSASAGEMPCHDPREAPSSCPRHRARSEQACNREPHTLVGNSCGTGFDWCSGVGGRRKTVFPRGKRTWLPQAWVAARCCFSCVASSAMQNLMQRLADHEKALVRSQSGPLADAAFFFF